MYLSTQTVPCLRQSNLDFTINNFQPQEAKALAVISKESSNIQDKLAFKGPLIIQWDTKAELPEVAGSGFGNRGCQL